MLQQFGFMQSLLYFGRFAFSTIVLCCYLYHILYDSNECVNMTECSTLYMCSGIYGTLLDTFFRNTIVRLLIYVGLYSGLCA